MNRKQGFTLIELLVVLAIVAFLAFVTVPLASGWIRNAQLEKDFAGIQRALGTAKAIAMRNSTGAATIDAGGADIITAVLCRSAAGNELVIVPRTGTAANQQASCALLNPANDRPVYRMGQDVAITYGDNQPFCGAQFTARGTATLCTGSPCTACTPFNPTTGLNVVVTGADTPKDPSDATKADPKDQSHSIKAF